VFIASIFLQRVTLTHHHLGFLSGYVWGNSPSDWSTLAVVHRDGWEIVFPTHIMACMGMASFRVSDLQCDSSQAAVT